MKNFLEETIKKLKTEGKTQKDIKYIQLNDEYCYWEDFEKLADFIYDNDFGIPKILLDLKIVGNDFWLERHEYDGAEWWEFKTMPKKPTKYNKNLKLKDMEGLQ